MVGKRLVNTGGAGGAAAFDPLQNFETVTYTGNGSTQKITGYIRKGAAFNGSSSNITATSPTQGNTDASYSFWVNTSTILTYSASQPNYPVFGQTSDSARNPFTIFWYASTASGKMAFNIFRCFDNQIWYQTGYLTDFAYTFSANTWYHITLTYVASSKTVRCYVDGSEIGSGATLSLLAGGITTGTQMKIGSYNTTGYYNGKLDQVRIFDKALSSGEVTTLYGETYASSTKSTTDIFNDGSAVALYELDEDADNTGIVANVSEEYARADMPIVTDADFDGTTSGGQTVAFWFKTDTSGTGYHVALSSNTSQGGASTGSSIFIGNTTSLYSDESLGFWDYNGATTSSYHVREGTNTYRDGTYRHCAIVSTSTSKTIYINGVSKTISYGQSGSASGNMKLTDITFGSGLNTSSVTNCTGIKDVRVFEDALTSQEVGYLYNENASQIALLDNKLEYTSFPYNGTPTNVNFLGMAFQPDLVWIKNRDATNNHTIFDSIRGNNFLQSSTTNQEQTSVANTLSSFDTNGFTVSGGGNAINGSYDYVAWCWKAGGAAVSNTDGSITSSVSANPDAGFSIVNYTGSATANQTVGHGLSQTPELIIVKNRDTGGESWAVQSSAMGGADWYMLLNSTQERRNNVDWIWNDTEPTSTVFTVGQYGLTNQSPDRFIAYCFHSVDGYQKVGSYTGNGTISNTVTIGFRPRWIMIKRSSSDVSGGNWIIKDSVRDGTNPNEQNLYANLSAAEETAYAVDFNDTGFEIKETDVDINKLNGTYIFLAIA